MSRTGQLAAPKGGPWKPPSSFEEYRVVSPLSHGGMGDVYLGHDTLLDRPVAIKFIGANEPDAWMREQFLTEARAAARLQHPNVASVYRVGEIDGRPYIIEELVRGQGLDSLLTPLPWRRVLELGRGLARGLAAAHRCGVLHRDIKPGNAIISSSGEVKLIDFGLAEFVEIDAASDAATGSEDEIVPLAATSKISAIAQTVDVSKRDVPVPGPVDSGSPARELAVAQTAPQKPLEGRPNTPPSARPLVRIAGGQTSEVMPRRGPSWRRGARHSTRIVGTPHYMAPEIWLGEPSTRQSDLYAMGALLFELCTGVPPHNDKQGSHEELCHAVNTQDVPSLTTLVADIDPLFAGIVARCLRRDASERYTSADELRDALDQLRPLSRVSSAPEGNPYRGLFAFEAEHRSLFFGRSNEIGTVIERLRSEAFILIAADSGVGKSSLCRAGILPLISEGAFGDGRQWQTLTLVPGRQPISALCAAVAPLLDVTETQLAERLRTAPATLARDLPKQLGDKQGAVLFIDQLEEIITLASAEEAALFGKVLGRLTMRVPGLRMLMTARSDFLARIASLAGLGDDLARALYFLRPMYPEKIREAIVGPAQVKGVRFESAELVDTLVDETAKTEGGLPLLQFALTELWDTRSGELITFRSLEAIGGASGALARHADQVILSLPADQRIAARRILLRLVTVEGTRARRYDEELGRSDAAKQALEALTRGRMIIAHATSDGIIYEVAHEALLKGWGTLRHWLEEFADSCAVKQRIETAAAEWVRLGRAKAALWSTPQLAELDILDPADFTTKEQAFITASQQALSRSRLLRIATIIAIPLALALFYGGIQYKNLRERSHKVALHLSRGQALLLEARRQNAELAALRRSAFAAFDSQRKDDGEKLWSSTLVAMQKNDAAFVQASQSLEAALAIDATRSDVRTLLAESLFEGAQAADRDGRVARRNELQQRMALYDLDGARQKKWHTPAQLTVETSPASARVTLQRYVEDAQQHRRLAELQDLGSTPLRNVALSEGSYLLTFARPGRLEVRYPIVLKRGEAQRIDVELPGAADLPEGFVYVPGGRFLFGTASDESVRQSFLSTVPLHELSIGAFVIGQFEVTYADWLEYLNALPLRERLKRAVHVTKGGIGGGVDLKQLGDGSWQLTLQPVTQQHVVRGDEPLHYASRKNSPAQSWLRLPISGLGPDDIRAYAEWLDQQGRVPGARLCTEYEWERAARGADDREYPHGNSLAPSEANFDETYGKVPDSAGPDEVGSHPLTQSPFGVMDLAGNVFEWTTSSLARNELALRGGGYFMSSYVARSTNRTTVDPGFRDPSVGARICATFRPRT